MKRTEQLGCVLLMWLAMLASASQGANILFMHQPNNVDFDDALVGYMESLGHTVEVYDTSVQDPIEQIELAEAADVVYVTESLGSGTTHDGVETHIKEVATPQIWAEAYAWDESAMVGDVQFTDFGNTQRAIIDENPTEELQGGHDSLFIVKPGHPLAGGFTGSVQVYNDEYSLNWGLIASMGSGVDVIATADEAGEYATLFVYEKGAQLEDGTSAAERRIGFWLGQAGDGAPIFDNLHPNGLKLIQTAIDYALGRLQPGAGPSLQAGDADQDLDFDQLDLVRVQIAAKYLTGQPATWGQGDWNGAPGGSKGSPPAGNGFFDQLDVIAALGPGHYLKGPYAAVRPDGTAGDNQTSVGYNPSTGELFVDAPAGTNLTSVNIDSAAGVFTGSPAQNLGGSFDNDSDTNIFKATFGSSFGSISFGTVARTGLAKDFVVNDLTVVGSLAGGGALGQVDLIYVPEPGTLALLCLGLVVLIGRVCRVSLC
jgi:hypothetical protein